MNSDRLKRALAAIGAHAYFLDEGPNAPDLVVAHLGRLHAFVFRVSRKDKDRGWNVARGKWKPPPGFREVSFDEEVMQFVMESSSGSNPGAEIPTPIIAVLVRLESVADDKLTVKRRGWKAMSALTGYNARFLRKLLTAAEELGMLTLKVKRVRGTAEDHEITVKIHAKWAPSPKRAFFVRKRRKPRLCWRCSRLATSENAPELCAKCYQKVGRKDRSWHPEARRLARSGVGILSIYSRLSGETVPYSFPDGETIQVPKYDINLYSGVGSQRDPDDDRSSKKMVQPSLADVLIEGGFDTSGDIRRAQIAHKNEDTEG